MNAQTVQRQRAHRLALALLPLMLAISSALPALSALVAVGDSQSAERIALRLSKPFKPSEPIRWPGPLRSNPPEVKVR